MSVTDTSNPEPHSGPRPLVTLKYAQTLDGRIATSEGQSRWISSPESRLLAHRLRAKHAAVLVGVGTVLQDDPQLTVRLCEGANPVRIVADSRLRTPLNSALLRDNAHTTIIAAAPAAPEQKRTAIEAAGARVLEVPTSADGLDLKALLEALVQIGIGSVLVEGGAAILTSMLRLALAQRAVIFIAPKIIGTGLDAIGELNIRTMKQALTLLDRTVETAGQDVVVTGRLRS